MGKLTDGVQPAVKKETGRVFFMTALGVVIMWIAFFVLHIFFPDDIYFGYKVFTAGVAGLCVAVLNFFVMGLTVQKVASEEDEKKARNLMKMSYSRRMLLQIAWIVIALTVPCFYWVAGILPLLFPSLGIKAKGVVDQKQYNKRQEVERKQDGD